MIDAPQPTNRKLRRTAAEQADCPTATSVGAHIVRPGNPAPEQAPLSKGAGRGASRGLGDCPAVAATPEQADCPTATPVGAHIVRPGNPTGMPLLSNGSQP